MTGSDDWKLKMSLSPNLGEPMVVSGKVASWLSRDELRQALYVAADALVAQVMGSGGDE